MEHSDSDWIGREFNRKEDLRLTTGKGQYFADIRLHAALHLVFVRSSRAHALIKRIDTSAAGAMAGVFAVVTGSELQGKMRPMPQQIVVPALPGRFPTFWPLAVDKVKFNGEPVAAVVAKDRYIAEDAAEAIEIEYEDLPYVGSPEEAMKSGAPIIHQGWEDNKIFDYNFTGGATLDSIAKNDAEVDRLIREAPVVIKRRFKVHRTGVTPLDTRGAMASWDPSDGMTCWVTTQRPHIDRLALADLLDIPTNRMRVIAPRDQGGGFGVKAPFYREPILVAYMAKQLDRPVRWQESREEHLMSVSQERDQIHDLEIGANNDGKIIALRDRGLADVGDGCEGVYWGFVMPFLGSVQLPNGYDLPKCDIKLKCYVTNKSALSPARAFGNFPARFAMDRMVDLVARAVGKEPADVRRLNLVTKLPYTTATGGYLDSGDFLKVFDTLTAKIDVRKFRREQADARSRGRYLGLGFGIGAEMSGVASAVLVPMENQPGFGAATVRIDPRGKVQILEGDAPQGQGHETTFAQVVASEFGIEPSDIGLVTGDTGVTPFGSGTIGARGGSYTVSAVANACRHLKLKMAKILAHDLQLDAPPADFEFANGMVAYKKEPTKRRSFAELAERIIMAPINLPVDETAGLEFTAFFEAPVSMICFSAHACIVEVVPRTGQFKILRYVTAEDVGKMINPAIVEGQVQGGVIQGLSNTMFEEFLYDENGQQLTTTFETYKMAIAPDVPHVEVTDACTPCPHTPLGTRGMGEAIPGPVPGALTNAVCDALTPFQVEITDLPLRPDRIWKSILDAKRANEALKQ